MTLQHENSARPHAAPQILDPARVVERIALAPPAPRPRGAPARERARWRSLLFSLLLSLLGGENLGCFKQARFYD